MRFPGSLPILASALVLIGCAGAGASSTATPGNSSAGNRTDPATLVSTGEPRQCLSLRDIQQTVPAGDTFLMARTGANRWHRNQLRQPCPGLARDVIIVFRARASQVCDGDPFDMVERGSRMNAGFCILGRFEPVEVPRGSRF